MTQFRMPAEWEPHAATWLAWPHEKTDWPGKFTSIPWVYGEIVRHLSRLERVRILVNDADAEEKALKVLRKTGAQLNAVDFFRIATDRSWTRDFCPIFVRDNAGAAVLLNWRFNGWAKYANSERDDAVTAQLLDRLGPPPSGLQMITPEHHGERIVLEGGSIDVNGSGLILTTEECLLSEVQARNPGMSRHEIEQVFGKYLGATETIWLRNGIVGDDTHGHVDDLARFTDPATVVIASEADPADANYAPLKENLALLKEQRGLRVETLPMPQPVYFGGQRLPASYANFYVANGAVLVPTFNDPNDRLALNKLAELFPDRQIIGIAATDLVLGLGTLHCMTQQEPACAGL